MYDHINSNQMTTRTAAVCRRCRFHPASPRIAGYCSWDCYEADDDTGEVRAVDDIEGQKAAWAATLACA